MLFRSFGKEPENQAVPGGQTSIIAQGCKFDGKVEVQRTLRIEGEFKGTVGTPETLVVGKTGVVHAEVKVKNAIIGGQLYGNIAAENKIELQSGSHVEGDITHEQLSIETGAFFQGRSLKLQRPAPAPQPAPSVSTAAPPPTPPIVGEVVSTPAGLN